MKVRVEEALELLDLTEMRDRPLDALSGGEKQRVAIAAALALRPRILVLDEPTSQLDPQSAEDLLQALVRLNQDLGLTVILCEHRLERVLAHCDRMLSLSLDGGLEHDGPPQAVLPHIGLTPPLVTVGKALGWRPLPLTIQDGRRFASRVQAPPEPERDARARAVPRTRSDTPALAIANLSHAYDGVPALSGVSLSVAQGEMVALMGRNGSGKSTLLNCVVGLLRPSGGDVRVAVAGRAVLGDETADICRRVGYLPQDPDALLFADTVRDELLVTLRNHGLRPENSPAPLSELLEVLGLDGEAEAYPRDLSVGQRQRVALGAVTVTRPGLLLLDEPTRGQDYPAKRDLVALLRRWQAAGTGVLMATHDVELVAQAADRVVILSGGEVIADGQAAAVLGASPLFAPQVARLFPDTGWLTAEDVLAAVSHRA
jgi:energy-coupling factor transport system ATP-binding protein